MRATVTVDHDVDQLLRLTMLNTGQNFKVTLNQAIRKGLANVTPDRVEKPFVVQPTSLGVLAGIDPSLLQELGDELEVDAFLSLTDSPSRTTDESR
jgi:hypothetical protein